VPRRRASVARAGGDPVALSPVTLGRATHSDASGVVYFGGRDPGWLYSRNLYPDPHEFEARVERLLRRAAGGTADE
jgi:hypothetical protein